MRFSLMSWLRSAVILTTACSPALGQQPALRVPFRSSISTLPLAPQPVRPVCHAPDRQESASVDQTAEFHQPEPMPSYPAASIKLVRSTVRSARTPSQTVRAAESFSLQFIQTEISPSDHPAPDTSTNQVSSIEAASPTNQPPSPRREVLTPLQTRQLELTVEAVSLDEANVGTGLVPPRQHFVDEELYALPDVHSRGAPYFEVRWQPSNICHFPLYYEDVMLERHGHVRWGCCQPLVSGVRFFGTIPMTPYLATIHPPKQGAYVLGHFRPGTAAPALRQRPPWNRRAAIVETLSLAGFFWGAPL
ncbi:MAG: hypothetical protein KatS3mg111_2043 [Pirellulaceae bacterium]|nr:MAG: hypothetical protein KatS3mg111_2043 [Pirellulaceae bacterium]